MPPAESEDARLLRLEEKVAYQDKLIAELNEVVVELRRENEKLAARVKTVEAAIRTELDGREVPNERPPHY